MINFKPALNNDLNAVTVISPSGKSFAIKTGDVFTASIFEVAPNGSITLKVNGELINARTNLTLQKDLTGLFKALDTPTKPGSELKLQFLGYTTSEPVKKESFKALVDAFSNFLKNDASLTEANIESLLKLLPDDPETLPKEIRLQLQNTLTNALANTGRSLQGKLEGLLGANLNNLPEAFKEAIAELKQKITLDVQNLTSNLLKNALRDSGVALEAKLKALASMQASSVENPLKSDLKAVLLMIKENLTSNRDLKDLILNDNPSLKLIDGILKDISTYQALSRLTNSFYTFSPVSWEGLKDADIAFKKNPNQDSSVPYSCRINLNLADCGKVQALVLMHKNEFFVTFKAQDEDFAEVLTEGLDELKEAFYRQGMYLKGATVLDYDDKAFEDIQNLQSVSQIVSLKI